MKKIVLLKPLSKSRDGWGMMDVRGFQNNGEKYGKE